MKHVIVCREYPPAPYPPGGIGTYVRHLARLLAGSGESVHVVAQRWEGAPSKVTESCGGRLIVHRVSLNDEIGQESGRSSFESGILQQLAESDCPSQAFSWQVARVLERLVETEGIDLIEAPEWEAPLYYYQLRRAVGLGPRQRPPCFVHLHSPSELIFRHNQWDLTLSDYQPLRRLEEYTVRAADAILCPSHYLAGEAQQLFDLAPGRVHVIPYPLGDTPRLERDPEVWRRDSICYAGRLELRKGVVEWVDAAVEVARSHPGVEFDFIGSDTSLDGGPGRSVRDYLNARIPRLLRKRFHFYGSMPREKLMEALARNPIAVVPSRWENLPYSCIEAMCTGLPVLVSPTGGMTELIADGESGWVAPDATAAGLSSVLRRVLDTPAPRRAAMGRNAEAAVRRICSNESVLQRHLEWRKRVVDAGPLHSFSVPAPTATQPSVSARQGMAVVVTCLGRPDLLPGCLESIRRQTQVAGLIMVAGDAGCRPAAGNPDVEFLEATSAAAARNLCLQRVLQCTPRLRGVVFVNEGVRLEPEYLRMCESVLDQQPGVGLVTSFLRNGSPRNDWHETPSLGAQWTAEDLDSLPCAAVRVEALQCGDETGAAWAAVTYPGILAAVISAFDPNTAAQAKCKKRYSVMALAQHGSAQFSLHWFLAVPWTEKAGWVWRVVTRPRRTAHWLAWQLRAAAARAR